MADWKPEDRFPDSPYMRGLPPLRIPSGWMININDLDLNAKVEGGDVVGTMLFLATNESRRFTIEVNFRPEFDPNGAYIMDVDYWPWPRTEKGRRRNNVAFASLTEAKRVHTFETRSVTKLAELLQHWIARCSVWTIEGH